MEEIKLSVSNFGPIESGTLIIKPLTILLGKNNTGKSYVAMLIHTFIESVFKFQFSLGGREALQEPRYIETYARFPTLSRIRRFQREASAKLKEEFSAFVKAQLSTNKPFELPVNIIQEMHTSALNLIETDFKDFFVDEVERIFGCNIAELCSHGSDHFEVSFDMDYLKLSLRCQGKDVILKLYSSVPSIEYSVISEEELFLRVRSDRKQNKIRIEFSHGFVKRIEKERGNIEFLSRVLLNETIDELMSYLLRFETGYPFSLYLPAARSGILSAHKLVASGLLRELPYVGLKKMEFLPLGGTVTDFLANIIQLSRHRGRFADLAKFLEDEVTGGRIDIKEIEKLTYPEIFYKIKDLQLPLYRSSSMVSEIAPLVLYLRYIISPKSRLIIEEPESHLHPGAQRKLAKVLVRLVNREIGVIITSHSDFLLSQIQNLVRMSQITSEDLKKIGYCKEDQIVANNVGVYLFKSTETGKTVIRSVDILDETMQNSGFNEVTDELYEESVKIDRILANKK